MSLSKSKCLYSNNFMFFKACCSIVQKLNEERELLKQGAVLLTDREDSTLNKSSCLATVFIMTKDITINTMSLVTVFCTA